MKGKYLAAFVLITLIDPLFITGFRVMSEQDIHLNDVFSPKVKEIISNDELENTIQITFVSENRIKIKNRLIILDSLEYYLKETNPTVVKMKLLPEQSSYISIIHMLELNNIDVYIPLTNNK